VGTFMESAIVNQLKKGQGETNRHLDALLAEQRRTNEWLARIASLMEAQMQMGGGGQQWTGQQVPVQQPAVYGHPQNPGRQAR
jgi:hypothetical protein